jgi:hypothetical protein
VAASIDPPGALPGAAKPLIQATISKKMFALWFFLS